MTSAIHGGRLADGKYSCAPSQGDAPPFYRQQHHPGWGGLVVRSRMRPGPRSWSVAVCSTTPGYANLACVGNT